MRFIYCQEVNAFQQVRNLGQGGIGSNGNATFAVPFIHRLLAVGTKPADPKYDPAELAALASVAGTILCMDENVTKP